MYDGATSGIDNERGREGNSGAGSSSVTVSRVRWVSLVICVGQAGVCTVIYPQLGLGSGGRVLIRLGLCSRVRAPGSVVSRDSEALS